MLGRLKVLAGYDCLLVKEFCAIVRLLGQPKFGGGGTFSVFRIGEGFQIIGFGLIDIR